MSFLRSLAFLPLLSLTATAEQIDSIDFGNHLSEEGHAVAAVFSDILTGGHDESARRLLPLDETSWKGGALRFTMKVDGKRQNYFTVKLWGDEVNKNQLTHHIDGKQIGYRHLGDIEVLDLGTDGPAYPGRFYYKSSPLPLTMTKGRDSVDLEIRASGPIWGYGKNFDQYQKPMTEPSRGIYAVYTHTDGCFIPPEEGEAEAVGKSLPARKGPSAEVLDHVKRRVNREIEALLRDPKVPCNQMQALFLAKAYRVKWCRAFSNPACELKILSSLDEFHSRWLKDPSIAEKESSTWNPEWFGLGPAGQIIELMKESLGPHLDEVLDRGDGTMGTRGEGYRDMLIHCRDWHREHRRLYTNQSMINDLYGIYLANRGIAVVSRQHALPEKQALRYLYESIGLEPWLGSEKEGKATKPLGDSYFQLTSKGLTKELGFVGTYGEVIDWVCQIYAATGPAFGEEGDPRIKEQLVKIAQARAPFRYPLADRDGKRAMVQETIVGWRDTHYPGDVVYAQRASWDGGPLEAVAETLDAQLVGYAQQMLDDNQYFATIAKLVEQKGFRTTFGLLGVPDRYEILKSLEQSRYRLPMSPDSPDFVFSDEQDGVVAIKNGEEILYASLYWRARHGINHLGRIHYLTPRHSRIATVMERVDFTPSGNDYTRPNWTNFGFGNGGHRYPEEFNSAHQGEKLPIARIPDGVNFKPGDENIHAGKGDLYQLRYGKYFIAMNMSRVKTFKVPVPAGMARNLVTGKEMKSEEIMEIPPQETTVLLFK